MTVFPAEVTKLTEELALAYRDHRAPRILELIRNETPVDTGILRQQQRIDAGLRRVANGWVIRFRALPYWGVFVQRGHGVIVPVTPGVKVLRFRLKTGQVIFTKRVGPVAANPYMYRAFVRAGLNTVRKVYR